MFGRFCWWFGESVKLMLWKILADYIYIYNLMFDVWVDLFQNNVFTTASTRRKPKTAIPFCGFLLQVDNLKDDLEADHQMSAFRDLETYESPGFWWLVMIAPDWRTWLRYDLVKKKRSDPFKCNEWIVIVSAELLPRGTKFRMVHVSTA